MAIRVAINGFGRIGRLVSRILLEDGDFDLVAVNDLTDAKQLAYLLKYDSTHRNYDKNVAYRDDNILVDGKAIKVYSEMDPSKLPWRDLEIDVVFECTGKFTSDEKAKMHLEAGAKKVLISAPAKGNVKTIVYGVNDNILTDNDKIVSAASCTTNCLAPVLKIIEDNIGIVKGFMTTIHAYTNDQVTLDVAHKKGIESRRGRASSINIVPTSTGAAQAIGKVIPKLSGKLLGGAIRVPVSDGSLIDLTLELKKNICVDKVNDLFRKNQNSVLKYTEDPIVSSDIISSTYGAVVDGLLTEVVNSDKSQLLKVVAWYDNEMGYSSQMVRTAKKMMNVK